MQSTEDPNAELIFSDRGERPTSQPQTVGSEAVNNEQPSACLVWPFLYVK